MTRMLVVGGVLTAVLAGCGGGSSGVVRSTSSSVGTVHNTPTITQPGAQAGSLAAVKQRLTAAGYSPRESEVSGNAAQGLEVDGVLISSYRTTAAATAEYGAMRALDRKLPGRGVARLVALHLYFLGKERQLMSTERARFEKIVRIAEGGR